MKSISLCIFLALATSFAHSADRPKITGIDHVVFFTTEPEANLRLYGDVLGLTSASVIEDPDGQIQRFLVGSQWVGYYAEYDSRITNRMDHVAFAADDCKQLLGYLAEKGVKVPDSIYELKDGSRGFKVQDPEGHSVEFVQHSKEKMPAIKDRIAHPAPISRHMIHVGFIVHDRAAEDHFYKDILGFHIYWYGGMQPDRTDWVAMQVPDGTDWLEYMLNIKPDADLRTTGVMNHISLGVKDMKQAEAKIDAVISQLPPDSKPRMDEHPKIGRDGKWQFNIYDPDQTRIELMEFTPAEKPCCSEFQGPHPSE